MSGTAVHVILTGIVSLIPSDAGYVVRLQDASTAAHEPHFATLVAEYSNVRTTLSPQVVAAQEAGPEVAAWRLPQGRLRVLSQILDTRLATSLDSVLRVGDACNGGSCGTAKRHADGLEFLVRRGVLATTAIEPQTWHWQTESPRRAREIAEEVCWTFRIPDRTLVLSIEAGDRKSTRLSITAPEGADIELRLQNVPELDFLPRWSADASHDRDPHAALYFLQSVDPPQELPVLIAGPESRHITPFNHRLAGRALGGRLSANQAVKGLEKTIRINCPPALWDGFAGATPQARPSPDLSRQPNR